MTKFEKTLPDENFISAGYHANHMKIDASSNPYKEDKYRALWQVGYERGFMRRLTPVRFDWQEL